MLFTILKKMNKKAIEGYVVKWIIGLAALLVILLILFTPAGDWIKEKITNLFTFMTHFGD